MNSLTKQLCHLLAFYGQVRKMQMEQATDDIINAFIEAGWKAPVEK